MEGVPLIPLDDILADDEWNCRMSIIPLQIRELSESIKENGLLQPIVVAPHDGEKPYKLIMGYRRWHAHRLLFRQGDIAEPVIRAIINDGAVDEDTAKALNLIENFHRENLNMLEEAKALLYFKQKGYTREQTAERIKMSPGWVQERFMLLELPDEVQIEAALGWISSPVLRELHTIFKKKGKLAVFEACKKAKDAKRRGEKISLYTRKPNPLRKAKRTQTEIAIMRDLVYETFGPKVINNEGLIGTSWTHAEMACRVLAWAVGDITDVDIRATLKAYASMTETDIDIPDYVPEDFVKEPRKEYTRRQKQDNKG